MAHLAAMLERGEDIGAAQQLDVGVRAVGPDFFQQILEANHENRCLTHYRTWAAGMSPTGSALCRALTCDFLLHYTGPVLPAANAARFKMFRRKAPMRSFSGATLAVAAVVALTASGCAKVGQLKAMKSFKAANQADQQQDYKKAAQLYEDTVAADPEMASAYFYLGNSYDQQFKPSKKGEPDNDAFLTKAAQNYQTAAEKLTLSEKPDEKKLAKLSLEYLVSVYGPDKLNDPAKAEPIVQKMIQID